MGGEEGVIETHKECAFDITPSHHYQQGSEKEYLKYRACFAAKHSILCQHFQGKRKIMSDLNDLKVISPANALCLRRIAPP